MKKPPVHTSTPAHTPPIPVAGYQVRFTTGAPGTAHPRIVVETDEGQRIGEAYATGEHAGMTAGGGGGRAGVIERVACAALAMRFAAPADLTPGRRVLAEVSQRAAPGGELPWTEVVVSGTPQVEAEGGFMLYAVTDGARTWHRPWFGLRLV